MGDLLAQWDAKWQSVRDKDAEAKRGGQLVGRYIAEPFADGKAIYEIVKATKTRVRIRVVTDIGDDWRIPYWGDEASIPRSYAEENIGMRDFWDKTFEDAKKKNKKK